MILLWGGMDDPPVAAVHDALCARGADLVHVDSGVLAAMGHDLTFDGQVRGWIEPSGRRVPVASIRAMYTRPQADPAPPPASAAFLGLAASVDAIVVNRPAAGRSNHAKPFQLGVIAAFGIAVPPTVVTTDPIVARAFLARHGRIIYKSISGVRSIVATLDEAEAGRLEGVRTGPVQLQRWIEGIDVRVHVVGRRWFATMIDSDAVDYRYASASHHHRRMFATTIPQALGERLVALASDMGLLLAGVDLRLTPEDEWYCFEVNPSPGFTFFEEATDQPIAAAVADLLLGGCVDPAGGRTR